MVFKIRGEHEEELTRINPSVSRPSRLRPFILVLAYA
jgi:hypothetical protein